MIRAPRYGLLPVRLCQFWKGPTNGSLEAASGFHVHHRSSVSRHYSSSRPYHPSSDILPYPSVLLLSTLLHLPFHPSITDTTSRIYTRPTLSSHNRQTFIFKRLSQPFSHPFHVFLLSAQPTRQISTLNTTTATSSHTQSLTMVSSICSSRASSPEIVETTQVFIKTIVGDSMFHSISHQLSAIPSS